MVNQIEHKCMIPLKYYKSYFDSNIAQNGYGDSMAFFLNVVDFISELSNYAPSGFRNFTKFGSMES